MRLCSRMLKRNSFVPLFMVASTKFWNANSRTNNPIWGKFEGTFFLLAVITPCSTGGLDASQCSTSYSATTVQIVTDLRAVQCVVGRVKSRGSWGIIDRSGNLARTDFISTGDQDENEEEVEN
jgi:hypothetical protein